MTDITSLIPAVALQLADFSIGFAKLSTVAGREHVHPAGSGALVSVGSVHGILTAAHVLEELPESGEVGLIRFMREPKIQTQTIEMSLTERLTRRGLGKVAEGPDIGFLRLASTQVATLNATTNIFFNLSRRQDSVLENKHPSTEYFEGISGIIAEWTINRSEAEARVQHLTGFRGLFGVGCVSGVHDHDGYDLVSFETDRNENKNAPIDYRGWSGGALWRVYITEGRDGQPTAIEKRIFGVAFHQSELVGGKRTVTCHGPKSVYQNLLGEIARKWPST
ncbi:hypothetical protein [Bradyrhizobium sp. LA6.7]|uniref:hypothetical protein n=1 Tax=unclassified Bradyrhizobium TaxID=2631580 RepID=UPI003398761F